MDERCSALDLIAAPRIENLVDELKALVRRVRKVRPALSQKLPDQPLGER